MNRGISDAWRKEMTGAVDVIDAGERHTEALDPSNPRFRAAIASALGTATPGDSIQVSVGATKAEGSTMQNASAG
jgi:hypothetical protein